MAFEKGKSGNPGGRKRTSKEFLAACREESLASLEYLIKVRDNSKEATSDRMRAAITIIEHAEGKPAQKVELTGAEGESLIPSITVNIRKSDL